MSGIYVKTAWRNVFRNRRRSAIVFTAIAIGLAGGLFLMLFTAGMLDQMLNTAVSHLGHIQIQHPEFADDPTVSRTIRDPEPVFRVLAQFPDTIAHYAPRLMARGLARSATNAVGVQIFGVDAQRESLLTNVAERMVVGHYLTGETSPRRQEVIIGSDLAEDLGVRMGRKIVLVTQALADGGTEMNSGAFRVVGVFQLASKTFNSSMVFINLEDAHELLNTRGLSEVTLMLRDRKMLFAAAERLDGLLDDKYYAVRTWRQASRSLVQMLEMSERWLLVYVVVVFFGAAFGIVNTMLMAVFERTHEFGILRAIGTGRWALFRLVIYEALFLSMIGTVTGMLLIGILHVSWLHNGLDLSVFEASLKMFGSDVVIKPAYRVDLIVETIVIVMLMSVLAAIWPALRAALLQPAEAMRE